MRHSIFILIIFTFLLASCQSVVRFSDKNKTTNKCVSDNTSQSTKSKTNPKKTDDNSLNKREQNLLGIANKWLGVKYRYGGTDKDGVDCSGLVYNVYYEYGIILPRTADQQYNFIKRVEYDNLQVGDLIFFSSGGKVSHVGIYTGNNTMIHASTSKGVIYQDLSQYLNNLKIVGYGRP